MERTPYMQLLMTLTYYEVPMEAILHGFDGSWERVIAKRLERDYKADHSEAVEIVDCIYTGHNFTLKEAFLKAAHLITSSKTVEHA